VRTLQEPMAALPWTGHLAIVAARKWALAKRRAARPVPLMTPSTPHARPVPLMTPSTPHARPVSPRRVRGTGPGRSWALLRAGCCSGPQARWQVCSVGPATLPPSHDMSNANGAPWHAPRTLAGLKAGSLVSAAVLGTDMLASRASAQFQFPDNSDGETDDGPAYTPLPQT
jgi:hypothetical protein